MLEFPPLVPRDLPPAVAMTSHISGGAGKTTFALMMLDVAWRSSCRLFIFENDRQPCLAAYGDVQRVLLAPAEEIVHDSLADVMNHASFDTTVRGLQPGDFAFYDGAAASLNRHSYVWEMLNFAGRLEAMGRYMMVAVPVTTRADLARESLVVYETWRELLSPAHIVIPVILHRDGDPRKVPAGHDLHTLVKLARDGVIVQPRIPMPILIQQRRSGMKLCELADARDPLTTEAIAKRIGMDPTIVELMRRCSADILTAIDPQLERLGFQLGL